MIIEMNKTYLIDYKWELLIIVIFVISYFLKILKIKLRDLLLILGLFVVSLIANRNVSYFYIIIPTIYIKCINVNFNFKNIKKRINFVIANILVIIYLISKYIFLIINFYNNNKDFKISDDHPTKGVNYIKNNLDYKNIKLYNEFNYGSYLEFYDIPVFIDSRAEVYIKEFNGGKDIIKDYNNSHYFNMYKKYLINTNLIIP